MKHLNIGNRIIALGVALIIAAMQGVVAASEPVVMVDAEKIKITYESFGTYYIDGKEYRSTEVTFTACDEDRMLIFPEPVELSGKFYTKVSDFNIVSYFYEQLPVPDDAELPGFGNGMFKYMDAGVSFTAYVLYPAKYSESEMISKFRFTRALPGIKETPYIRFAYPGERIVLKY